MKRRQEAAEEAERARHQADEDAKAAAEAEIEAARQAEQARDSHDAPGSPHSSREHEAGKFLNTNYCCLKRVMIWISKIH